MFLKNILICVGPTYNINVFWSQLASIRPQEIHVKIYQFWEIKVSLKVICFHICYIYFKIYIFVIRSTKGFINILAKYGIIFSSVSNILIHVYLVVCYQ